MSHPCLKGVRDDMPQPHRTSEVGDKKADKEADTRPALLAATLFARRKVFLILDGFRNQKQLCSAERSQV
jgi:hypothetical protein